MIISQTALHVNTILTYCEIIGTFTLLFSPEPRIYCVARADNVNIANSTSSIAEGD